MCMCMCMPLHVQDSEEGAWTRAALAELQAAAERLGRRWRVRLLHREFVKW